MLQRSFWSSAKNVIRQARADTEAKISEKVADWASSNLNRTYYMPGSFYLSIMIILNRKKC